MAELRSQGAKPEVAQSLRHSMEKEMQQQVTQLEVGVLQLTSHTTSAMHTW